MSERRPPRGVAAWRHWDAVALGAGAGPLLALLLFRYEVAHPAFQTSLLVGALILYPVAALFAWRQRDGRLAAAGGLLLILAMVIALPLIALFLACIMGDCI